MGYGNAATVVVGRGRSMARGGIILEGSEVIIVMFGLKLFEP